MDIWVEQLPSGFWCVWCVWCNDVWHNAAFATMEDAEQFAEVLKAKLVKD